MSSITDEVDFLEKDDQTVAVVGNEAYVVTEDTAQIHKVDDGVFLLITSEEVYEVHYDTDRWMVMEDVDELPEHVQELLEDKGERYAEADVSGYPVEFTVGYGGEDNIFRAAWRNEKIRPSDSVAQSLQNEISEVQLDVIVDEDGHITVTGVDVWPDSSSVSIDI